MHAIMIHAKDWAGNSFGKPSVPNPKEERISETTDQGNSDTLASYYIYNANASTEYGRYIDNGIKDGSIKCQASPTPPVNKCPSDPSYNQNKFKITELDISPKGMELLRGSEGKCNYPYNDSNGYCTIGVGHLIHKSSCICKNPSGTDSTQTKAEQMLEDCAMNAIGIEACNKLKPKPTPNPIPAFARADTITSAQIETLLDYDLKKMDGSAQKTLRGSMGIPSTCLFSQAQYDALASYIFNRGCGNAKTMIKKHLKQCNLDKVESIIRSDYEDKTDKNGNPVLDKDGNPVPKDGIKERRKAEADRFNGNCKNAKVEECNPKVAKRIKLCK